MTRSCTVKNYPGEVGAARSLVFMEKKWFVIHTYSGYENKVKANLEKRVASMNMQDKIFRILVPMEDEIEIKDGKRRVSQKRYSPVMSWWR